MAFINLKALPSANTFHCFLREKTVYFSDEVFSLRFRGYFKQQCTMQCTVVELSTRTAFLNIDKSLQFRNFWSQSKAFFMIRCMLSDGSGFKTFGALKVTICINFLEHSVYKICNFLRISACQWTMPSGLFAKKSQTKIFCSCWLLLVTLKMTRQLHQVGKNNA